MIASDAQLGRCAQGLQYDAVPFRQLEQAGELLLAGLGVEREVEPDRAESDGYLLAHAERPAKVELTLRPFQILTLRLSARAAS